MGDGSVPLRILRVFNLVVSYWEKNEFPTSTHRPVCIPAHIIEVIPAGLAIQRIQRMEAPWMPLQKHGKEYRGKNSAGLKLRQTGSLLQVRILSNATTRYTSMISFSF